MKNKYFIASSIRLMRFLYSLGFDKKSFINDKGYENWKFEHTDELQEALNFYFEFRDKNFKKGVNENEQAKIKQSENRRNLQNSK